MISKRWVFRAKDRWDRHLYWWKTRRGGTWRTGLDEATIFKRPSTVSEPDINWFPTLGLTDCQWVEVELREKDSP